MLIDQLFAPKCFQNVEKATRTAKKIRSFRHSFYGTKESALGSAVPAIANKISTLSDLAHGLFFFRDVTTSSSSVMFLLLIG